MTPFARKSSRPVFGAAIRNAMLALFLVVFGASPVFAQTRAYVANFNDNTVSVIDSATNTVVATVPVGTNPEGRERHKDQLRLLAQVARPSEISYLL